MLKRLKRLRYFAGQFLSAEDLRAEQDYFREKSKRHNRVLHGSGVVSGLKVAIENGELHLSPGMALDCEGNEIVVDAQQTIALPPGRTGAQYLTLRYAETATDFSPTTNGESEAKYIEEAFALAYETGDPYAKHALRGKLRGACGVAHAVALAKLVFRAGRWRIDRTRA
jgi:hypothetical protein